MANDMMHAVVGLKRREHSLKAIESPLTMLKPILKLKGRC